MNNIKEILQAISIGLVVANFLLKAGLVLKAIDLCKESLVLLNDKAVSLKKEFRKFMNRQIYCAMFNAYRRIHDNTNAIKCGRKLLVVLHERGETVEEGEVTMELARIYDRQNNYVEARKSYERAATIMREIGNKQGEAIAYTGIGRVSRYLSGYIKAKEYYEKSLAITLEIGDRRGEGASYGNLGTVFKALGEYHKAKEYQEKSLAIALEVGDRKGEGIHYRNLGNVYQSLGEYIKAKEYHEKSLAIALEIGNRKLEGTSYRDLGTVFQCLGEYVKAKEYLEKALAISIEIGDRAGESASCGNLGSVIQFLGEYVKAKEYYEKSLAISMELGDRAGEAAGYEYLGSVWQSLDDYVRAKEYHEKALDITVEIGDREGEGRSYASLGTVFQSLTEYAKAKEYHEKALAIKVEIGDREGEASSYASIGTVFQSLGEYVKANECHEKSHAIRMEIGDRNGEAANYLDLGILFQSLGEYAKAEEYHRKSLAISKDIGDKNGEAANYHGLANVFLCRREYRKSKDYYNKALVIQSKRGDRAGEAACYLNLRCLFYFLGDNAKAKEYYEKALEIGKKISDRSIEAKSYQNLGAALDALDDSNMAENYLEKAVAVSQDIDDGETVFECYCSLAMKKLFQGKTEEAFSFLIRSIKKSEHLRGFLRDSDQFKISFADMHVFPYKKLSALFCAARKPYDALLVLELERARALADLMATQYNAEQHRSENLQSLIEIKNFIKKERNCTFLYVSYTNQNVFLWILKTNGEITVRNITVDKKTLYTRLAKVAANLDEFFAIMAESFRSFGILPEEVCEDRSINSDTEPKPDSTQEVSLAALRQGKGEKDPKPSLSLFHEMLIDPVSDFLKEPEIIIVPEQSLYRVPFSALLDKSGKYFSETFRIRIVPSLTTLKLIHDSPADYHCQTGALIVGDPDVGDVIYNERLNKNFVPLPGARQEAEMIGRLLGEQPLLGKCATKQAVLQRIHSVSLIHVAAHGNPERGEIALAPPGATTGIPQEDDYLLKMSDISQIQVRAKLVVLSCCHSGRGQIRAEGVVGIARAFLGSGARSVLVSLWALEDSATKQFMGRFYEHLIGGESASESLHEAMGWMRANGLTKVSEWAPFILIGDNVKFEFEKKMEEKMLSSEDSTETESKPQTADEHQQEA